MHLITTPISVNSSRPMSHWKFQKLCTRHSSRWTKKVPKQLQQQVRQRFSCHFIFSRMWNHFIALMSLLMLICSRSICFSYPYLINFVASKIDNEIASIVFNCSRRYSNETKSTIGICCRSSISLLHFFTKWFHNLFPWAYYWTDIWSHSRWTLNTWKIIIFSTLKIVLFSIEKLYWFILSFGF